MWQNLCQSKFEQDFTASSKTIETMKKAVEKYALLNTSLIAKTRNKSNKKKNTGNVNNEDSYQDIVNITEEF